MLDDGERGYRAGRRAGARFARNPHRDPQDPKIPSAVTDSVVYCGTGVRDGSRA